MAAGEGVQGGQGVMGEQLPLKQWAWGESAGGTSTCVRSTTCHPSQKREASLEQLPLEQ